jgi:hypothetical protein
VSAKHPLYDVVIPLHMASRHEADKLTRILTHDDEPPILAVMCDVQPNDTRWIITISIGLHARSNLAAIIRAGKYVRRACRQLGFDAHITQAGIIVGPSTLEIMPAPAEQP